MPHPPLKFFSRLPKPFYFLICVLLSVACTEDWSSKPAFKEFIRRDLMLKRPMLLGRIKPKLHKSIMTVFADYVLVEADHWMLRFYKEDVSEGEMIELPAGTRMIVDEVFNHNYMTSHDIFAKGSVVLPDGSKAVFQYRFESKSVDDFLRQGPWELMNKGAV